MGRPGAGGGGHSGGGFSSGRSGGGHSFGSGRPTGSGRPSGSRPSGSFRPDSSRRPSGNHGANRSGMGPMGGPGMGPMGGLGMGPMGGPDMGPIGGPGMGGPRPPRHRRNYFFGGGPVSGIGTTIATLLIIALLFIGVILAPIGFGGSSNHSSGSSGATAQVTSEERTKIDTDIPYNSDCIVDELDWFEHKTNTGKQLKSFWNKTGVQPYIILKSYDESLEGATDEETKANKEQWALDYYDANFSQENIFLYVYFADKDTEGTVGYMVYANGQQTDLIMDDEAMDIFWEYLESYWYDSDLSMDEVFIQTFDQTGQVIMEHKTNGWDVAKYIAIFAAVAAAGGTAVILIRKKIQRDREKAREDQEILNTPINDLAGEDLTEKYLHQESEEQETEKEQVTPSA